MYRRRNYCDSVFVARVHNVFGGLTCNNKKKASILYNTVSIVVCIYTIQYVLESSQQYLLPTE